MSVNKTVCLIVTVNRKWPSPFSFARFELLPAFESDSQPKDSIASRLAIPDLYPNLQLILKRPIDWNLIKQQYDQMVKYATALRLGTAETEAILRRFTRNNLPASTYRLSLNWARPSRPFLPKACGDIYGIDNSLRGA